MPYHIRKSTAKGGGYDVHNTKTGKKVAHSATKRSAQGYINARNAAAHGAKLGRKR